jgi:MEMO1 family protein
MKLVVIILISIIPFMETFTQSRQNDRQPVAAGRFYNSDEDGLIKDLSQLFATCKKTTDHRRVRAIISPHAGYIFSGRIAASAFSAVDKNSSFKNVFIIGSSHVMSFEGASVYDAGDFITPIGKATVNREIAVKLKNENPVFNFPTTAHNQEHSIEVQIPFIQHYFKNQAPIVPIIIGTSNEMTIRKIAVALKPYFTQENLFVISSDFSHYPEYRDAIESDKAIALAISSDNPQLFINALRKNASKNIPGLATSMCGWTSGLTLLYLAEGNEKLEIKLIDYCNSGDSPYGSKDEVVGYNAMAVFEKNQETSEKPLSMDGITFTEDEKSQLFQIARNSIKLKLFENKRYEPDEKNLPPVFKVPMGAFVTLKINGALRGCIGRFISSSPLYEVVRASALSSAFEDPRFDSLTIEEYKNTDIEITVLGPLKKINNVEDIVLGKHGIYIKKGMMTGTMLPQVATENHWTVEQFLGYTSRDKAGIGWDGWKDAELFIYEGIVLEENRK